MRKAPEIVFDLLSASFAFVGFGVLSCRIFRSLLTLLAFVGLGSGAAAQDRNPLPEHFYTYEGCYELEAASEPDWLEVLEDTVQLTLVELVPSEGVVVRQFVVRAGPGQQASWYPKVSWLLVGNSGPLQVGWEWPGYDWVTAVFQVDQWDGESPLEGTIRHATDVIGYAPEPISIRMTRVGCPSAHP